MRSEDSKTPGGEHPHESHAHHSEFMSRITAMFVDSKLVPPIILAALLIGLFAAILTPSEEEPQIIVPMIDIQVAMPGATPKEIESRVVTPMEKLLWEIPGVEYLYSTASEGRAVSIVRFKVGEDVERSLIKTYAKLYEHLDWIPPGCTTPLLKPRSIDDVPIVVLTFWSKDIDPGRLRTVAANVEREIKSVSGVAQSTLIGGTRTEAAVEPDPDRLRSLGLDLVDLTTALSAQNRAILAGDVVRGEKRIEVRLDNFFRSVRDVENALVAAPNGKPVYVRDVAKVSLRPTDRDDYVFFVPGPGEAGAGRVGQAYPAVSLAVAKRAGVNAYDLSTKLQQRVEELKGYIIPRGENGTGAVEVSLTRDYGQTAKDKSTELLEHLLIAAFSVGLIVTAFLGARAGLVVMVAVPVTLAVTLATYYFLGYTLNRVTLFALIFCIGIIVDDPIVDVENIVRHLGLPGAERKSMSGLIIEAVNEVRAPLILATFTVIAAIMPMAFVGGLMGPYMRPMPIGASIAMFLSMGVAFLITPWTARVFLRHGQHHAHDTEDAGTRLYRRYMARLIHEPRFRWIFLGLVSLLFVAACSLFAFKAVLVKMLPFDNKSEFEVVIDMPRGTTMEKTSQVASELTDRLMLLPEVTDCQIYVGTSAPISFNGLIRSYHQREGSEAGEIQVNLVGKSERKLQSHDIAKKARELLTETAARHGAKIKVVEIPPGPPVLQTLVAEIYGPDDAGRVEVARRVKEVFARTPSVVDVDWYVKDPWTEKVVTVLPDKALASGVTPARVSDVLATSLGGTTVGLLHDDRASEDVPVKVRLPRKRRASDSDLAAIHLNAGNRTVSLAEVAGFEDRPAPLDIYHKNLKPVVYVTADMAGKEESPTYGMARIDAALERLSAQGGQPWQTRPGESLRTHYTAQPDSTASWSMKWDGEWQITYEVFRDMGIAFGAVMLLIYILVVGWFKSYTTPIAIMSPIPLSLIGIIPAHALFGAFFTATSMIGFIAGAGIVVRNSIILVDFVEARRAEGMPLDEAVIEAGAVRFRPMLLTAVAVIAGSFVILFDPIFQGLAISLMAGEIAATVFSRMVVPVMYYLDQR